jgi:hypothetical protein
MPKPRMATRTFAYINVTVSELVEVDVDELVEEYGPQAKTQEFLTDWIVGNYSPNVGADYKVEFDEFVQEEIYEYLLNK